MFVSRRRTWTWMWMWVWVVVWGGARAQLAALLGAHVTYDVQSTVLLAELAGGQQDVGYRLAGALTLEPVARDLAARRLLLRFRLEGVGLQLRGAHARSEWAPRASPWDAAGGGQGGGYAEWRGGRLARAFLRADAPPDVLNYQRALLSLFQFQVSGGEYNETDVSGECAVTYEPLSPTEFRKIKRRCAFEAAAASEAGASARRVSRYTLSAARDALVALHAEEVVWAAADAGAGAGADSDRVGVKARSWHALSLRASRAAAPADGAAALDAALAALPAELADTPLPLPLQDGDDDDDYAESLEEALEKHGAALGGWQAGEGGTRAQAAALSPLLRAARAAPAAALRELLHRPDLQDSLAGLCRLLGLAGTRGAWQAARALLAPAAADALQPLTHEYLAGLALAPQPQEEVVAEVLALGEEAKLAGIAESALLAGAAAAARAGEAAALAARERLARGLARARGPAERALHLRALGNLRREDTAELLLAAAERGAPQDAEAALGALRQAPPRALPPGALERAARLAGNSSVALAVRALALELAVERLCAARETAVPLALVRLARALQAERGRGAHELRRALWQRLEALGARPATAALRRVLPRSLASWDARAAGGSSSVLQRALGWRAGGWRGALHSAQLASGGVLLRGRVALQAAPPEGDALDLLAVEVWTRGLEGLAGEAQAEGEGEGEGGPAAGLRLAVRGAALRPLTLFDGQAELLGHIWAGTGAAPTRALRALVPLGGGRARVPLQAGAALALARSAAGALALDAQGAVSLWQRSARARLGLRAAGHADVRAGLRTAWSELSARAELAGEARLRIAPDLDFYDAMALCVRVDVAPHAGARAVELRSRGGARAWRVRRVRGASTAHAGRSLALGRANDAACRALAAADPEDDD